MNPTTFIAILVIILNVGVFGAPQWHQNEPYTGAYSSNDDNIGAGFNERGHRFENKTVRYKISQYSEVISDSDVDEIIANAFEAWSQVADLRFVRISQAGDADIDIRFAAYSHGCDRAFDGPGLVVAHNNLNYVHFDDSENWTRGVDGRGINLYAIAVHEIGHTLGLLHSQDRNAIMYAIYSKRNPTTRLSVDDIVAIQRIYGPKRASTRPGPMRPSSRPRTDASPGLSFVPTVSPKIDIFEHNN